MESPSVEIGPWLETALDDPAVGRQQFTRLHVQDALELTGKAEMAVLTLGARPYGPTGLFVLLYGEPENFPFDFAGNPGVQDLLADPFEPVVEQIPVLDRLEFLKEGQDRLEQAPFMHESPVGLGGDRES